MEVDVDWEEANVSALINWWEKYFSFFSKSTWATDSYSKVWSVLLLSCHEVYENREKLILLRVLVKHLHFYKTRILSLLPQLSTWRRCLHIILQCGQQVTKTNFSKKKLRMKLCMWSTFLWSTICNELYQCSEQTHIDLRYETFISCSKSLKSCSCTGTLTSVI